MATNPANTWGTTRNYSSTSTGRDLILTETSSMYETFYAQACSDVDGLTGIDLTLVKPLLENLGKLYGYLDELSGVIDREGAMVEKEVGSVNNRHMEMVENPALASFTKVAGRAGGLARQISAFTKNAVVIDEEEDDFATFNAEE